MTTDILQQLDMLVDGPFVEAKKDLRLNFRGSSNQRLIDKKRSLIAELMPTGYELDIREETKQSDAELASIAELMGGGEEVTINE